MKNLSNKVLFAIGAGVLFVLFGLYHLAHNNFLASVIFIGIVSTSFPIMGYYLDRQRRIKMFSQGEDKRNLEKKDAKKA